MWQQLKNAYHIGVAVLANWYYKSPSKNLIVIGVTGTDGKTTTVNMIYHILKSADKKVSMISTINAVIADKAYDTGLHVSSPDPFTIQKFASDSVNNGDEFLVLEVTSHALDQHRFLGIDFAIGIVTNITHDHLDYHKNWDNYFITKAKLIKNVKIAILNRDELYFDRLTEQAKGKIISFGFSSKAEYNQKKFPLNLKILGDFNLLNGWAAAAACSEVGISSTIIKSALNKFSRLKGRMEEIKNNKGLMIVVDFAATPNGLEQSLKTLRKKTKGRLISVFGSAGQRDISKRFLMGKISAKFADITIITAEDPRGELNKINEQIANGAKEAGAEINKNLFIINRREKAVAFAINNISKIGDTIGFFGKGHEESMNYDGKKEELYSEFNQIKKSLKK
ncbi:UDP-N-acetylmuramoyl-L-alanyl-D-glutamate--2,6-diaminopimelate ligase 1 [Candidatus Levyibacteriota bacterium]|nr:UDP-N-acetylmuramoyl-L-alanyl-D-glutamate--2,6-diaminopimelate ligase 1 [Candidatus Levybacteria bacterium]